MLGPENFLFADCFDAFYTIPDEKPILYARVPVIMLMDSGFLFQVIIISSNTSEKRLLIDLAATQNRYDGQDIDDIGCICPNDDMADSFTKIFRNDNLKKFLDTGVFN